MLKKKPSEKIVETTIHKQSAKTLHIEGLESKALELVKQFESRDPFPKLSAFIAESKDRIIKKGMESIETEWIDSPITMDPNNPEPWFSSIPAWRPSVGFERGIALTNVNARQTYLWVNQRIKEILEMNMFELNDEITREKIAGMIEQSIKPIVYDYTVICNETNNTSYTVDQGILNVDICLKINNDGPWTYAHVETSYRGIECKQ